MLAERESLESRALLLDRWAQARRETDKLFELVDPDARYARPIPERHRIIFYLGHLEAFDWNLLQGASAHVKPVHPEFDRLFAFGIDPLNNSGLPSDQPSDWPAYGEVQRYCNEIRQRLDLAIASETRHSHDEKLDVLLDVAIEHRLMHAETLAYMLHHLPYEKKTPQAQARVPEMELADSRMLEIPAGAVTLGLARDGDAFGWDNEYDAHSVAVDAFAIDRYKVTNAQYARFVEDGGYRDRNLWTPAGWAWKSTQGIEHPIFWRAAGEGWLYCGMFREFALPANWPVYVSHAEASAYAAWAGKRLPTEKEWQRACYGATGVPDRAFPWGDGAPEPRHGYFDFARWDPAPVNAFAASESAFGVQGALANGWEWTSTVFAPFDGFRPFPFYEGYSNNFFDGLHYVLKGGSPRTDRSMLRRSFRNWFQPHYQYVYAGFRCARDL